MVVYPRWRGELNIGNGFAAAASGLSPLARGTPVFANLWTIAIRFIPAGAGNTTLTCSSMMTSSVYPRWRGEHGRTEYKAVYLLGLSPLARGTL